MYGLTKEQKLKFIIEKSEELGISSYEYGQNTEISDLGARNILTGESKNPRTKNLNIMLRYLENKEETQREKELYEDYGGKKEYYKNKILEFIKNGNDTKNINKD